jgi:hypothetical protein
MQTLEGEVAKQITREEFQDVMKQVVLKAKAMLATGGCRWQPLWSWDHVSLHEDIDWHVVGIDKRDRVPLGVRAPDMHKPIEHVFALLKRLLHAELYRCSYDITSREAQQKLKDIFYSKVKPEHVAADVASLPTVYKLVSTPCNRAVHLPDGSWKCGTGGNWVPRAYR